MRDKEMYEMYKNNASMIGNKLDDQKTRGEKISLLLGKRDRKRT